MGVVILLACGLPMGSDDVTGGRLAWQGGLARNVAACTKYMAEANAEGTAATADQTACGVPSL